MAGIHRAGTYPATFKTPLPPAQYSKIRVSFSQNQQLLIEKENGDTGVTLNAVTVEVVLTQAETLLFRPSVPSPMGGQTGAPAFVQIRCYKSDLDAPASACWVVPVYDALNQQVMTGGGT